MSISRFCFPLPALLLASMLQAQVSPARQPSTQYWLTAGAGYGSIWDDRHWLGSSGSSMAAAVSVQHGLMVGSLRATRSSADGSAGWDLGVLAGVGSPSRYAMRGSIGAGLGLSHDPMGHTSLALPLELQLGWRLTPSFGIGTYLFGSILGTGQYFGAAAGIQIGKLR